MSDVKWSGGYMNEAEAALALQPLLDLARAQLPAPLPVEARRDPSYLLLRDRLERERLAAWRRSTQRWWLAPAAAILTVLLTGGGAFWLTREPVLSFTVQGGASVAEGGYLRAPSGASTRLDFSDGTRVDLQAASGGRVASTGRRGARVLLDHGRARVSVVPRRGGDWIFDAGPCRVQVTGTRFEMNWSERDRVLEVRLEHGSVTVKGPPSPDGVVMHAGQRLVMDVRRGFTRLEPLSSAGSGALAGSPTSEGAGEDDAEGDDAEDDQDVISDEGPEELPAGETGVPTAGAGRGRRGESWSARILAGDFSGVLRAARKRGFGRVLVRDGAPEVMALAEAARYSRQNRLARRALETLRTRFPESRQADKAAFLLGRMAEDVDGDTAVALDWYRRYLSAAPRGAYRDEALGRQMAATLKLSGTSGARPLAEAYLRRYPQGTYAGPARVILQRSE